MRTSDARLKTTICNLKTIGEDYEKLFGLPFRASDLDPLEDLRDARAALRAWHEWYDAFSRFKPQERCEALREKAFELHAKALEVSDDPRS